jgi:hypothetical protein
MSGRDRSGIGDQMQFAIERLVSAPVVQRDGSENAPNGRDVLQSMGPSRFQWQPETDC